MTSPSRSGDGRGLRAHHNRFLLVIRACLHAGEAYLSSSRLHRALGRGPDERKRLSLHVEMSEAVRPDFPSAFFVVVVVVVLQPSREGRREQGKRLFPGRHNKQR